MNIAKFQLICILFMFHSYEQKRSCNKTLLVHFICVVLVSKYTRVADARFVRRRRKYVRVWSLIASTKSGRFPGEVSRMWSNYGRWQIARQTLRLMYNRLLNAEQCGSPIRSRLD